MLLLDCAPDGTLSGASAWDGDIGVATQGTWPTGMDRDAEGNTYLIGNESYYVGEDVRTVGVIAKLDSADVPLWALKADDAGDLSSLGTVQALGAHVFISGQRVKPAHAWVLKLNPDGSLVRGVWLPTPDESYAGSFVSDGSLLWVSGYKRDGELIGTLWAFDTALEAAGGWSWGASLSMPGSLVLAGDRLVLNGYATSRNESWAVTTDTWEDVAADPLSAITLVEVEVDIAVEEGRLELTDAVGVTDADDGDKWEMVTQSLEPEYLP
jgi:hypothetical protein